jgi:hypothetical protein
LEVLILRGLCGDKTRQNPAKRGVGSNVGNKGVVNSSKQKTKNASWKLAVRNGKAESYLKPIISHCHFLSRKKQRVLLAHQDVRVY